VTSDHYIVGRCISIDYSPAQHQSFIPYKLAKDERNIMRRNSCSTVIDLLNSNFPYMRMQRSGWEMFHFLFFTTSVMVQDSSNLKDT